MFSDSWNEKWGRALQLTIRKMLFSAFNLYLACWALFWWAFGRVVPAEVLVLPPPCQLLVTGRDANIRLLCRSSTNADQRALWGKSFIAQRTCLPTWRWLKTRKHVTDFHQNLLVDCLLMFSARWIQAESAVRWTSPGVWLKPSGPFGELRIKVLFHAVSTWWHVCITAQVECSFGSSSGARTTYAALCRGNQISRSLCFC